MCGPAQSNLLTLYYHYCRADREKHSMKCAACTAGRPVDILQWCLPKPCPACNYSNKEEDRQMVDKYKELFSFLTELESTEIDDSVYDYLYAWCASIMNTVFADK